MGAEAEAVLAKPEVVVFGFGDQPAHAKAAAKLRESVLFAHTTSEEVMTKLGHKDAIVLFRPKTLQNKFEAAEVIYEGADPVDKWVKANYHGICGVRTTDNAADFKNPLVTAYYGVDYVKNAKGTNYWRNRVMKVAKNFPSLTFAVSNKDDFMQEVNEFGIGMITGDKPKVGIFEGKSKKFVMEDDFSVDALEKFVSDYKDGKLEPFLKSEDVPASQDKPVKVAVAKNFDDLIFNSGK